MEGLARWGVHMIDQIGITLTGVTAIFLTQSKHEWLRRYACLFGLDGSYKLTRRRRDE